MRIAFCLKENRIDSPLDERFGRAGWFGIIDGKTGEKMEIIENTAKNESSGAGGKAIQLLVNKDVEIIIAPEFGPKAFEALKALNITIFRQGELNTIPSALEAWKMGNLKRPEKAGHSGLHKA